MLVHSIAFLMTYNVLQPRMLPTVTRNVTFACTGVARRAAGGEEAGREREEKRKEAEEEMGRGSRIGRDGSRTRCLMSQIHRCHGIPNLHLISTGSRMKERLGWFAARGRLRLQRSFGSSDNLVFPSFSLLLI